MPYFNPEKAEAVIGSTREIVFAVFVVVFAGVIVYVSSLSSRFVYDDIKLIVINPYIRDITHLKELVGGGRPVRALTFMLDYAFWGYNPRGYHLTNLILHLVGAILFFWLLLKLFREVFLPFVSALFFVVHPATTEAVVAISHRKEMLAFIFLNISLLFYLSASSSERGNGDKFNLRVILLNFLSLMSYLTGLGAKQVVVVTPFLLWVIDAVFLHRTFIGAFKANYRRYAIYIILPLILLLLNKGDWRLFGAFPKDKLFSEKYFDIISASFWAITEYVKVSLFPVNLHIDHKVPESSIWYMLEGVIFLVIIGLGIKKSHRYSPLSFGLFWFIINLLPVLNIIPANEIFAERYLYIPLAGFAVLLASALIYLSKKEKFVSFSLALFYFLLGLIVCFWWRVAVRYPVDIPPSALVIVLTGTLGLYGVIYFSGKVRCLNSFVIKTVFASLVIAGLAFSSPRVIQKLSGERLFWEKSDYAGLMSAFRALSPDDAEKFTQPALKKKKLFNFSIINFLALGLVTVVASKRRMGDEETTIKGMAGIFLMTAMLGTLCIYRIQEWHTDRTLWSSTLKHNPTSVRAAVNLGVTYRRFGDYKKAFFAYGKAVKLDPSNFLAHYNLAIALLKLGRVPEAKMELIKTIELNPLYADAYSNLGNILVVERKSNDAIEFYKKSLDIRPSDAQVWYNLSLALDIKGDRDEALKACRKALNIKPDFPAAKEFCGYGKNSMPLK